VEAELSVVASDVDPVERQGMRMRMESKRRVKVLEEGHRAGLTELSERRPSRRLARQR
jgi:hypothetical protein